MTTEREPPLWQSDPTLAVYFDIDGTLLERRTEEDEVVPTASAFGIDLTDEEVHHFDDLIRQYFRRNVEDGYHEAVYTFTNHLGYDVDTEAFTAELKARKVENTRLPRGVEETLAAFADATTLGIITNGAGDVQRAKLAAHGLADYFESVLISGERDTMKPKDEMFALAKRDCAADRYVYVADRLGADLVPASENGFVTVWVSDSSSSVPDVTVPSVAELTVEAVRAAP